MVGQPHQNFMKMASWSSVSEHLVNPIGMSDQLKWNNHFILRIARVNGALNIMHKSSVVDVQYPIQ